jgi:hypothetical protein
LDRATDARHGRRTGNRAEGQPLDINRAPDGKNGQIDCIL